MYGTNTYPVTYQVLDIASGSFAIFMLIITAFYAGELVWRERDARMDADRRRAAAADLAAARRQAR